MAFVLLYVLFASIILSSGRAFVLCECEPNFAAVVVDKKRAHCNITSTIAIRDWLRRFRRNTLLIQEYNIFFGASVRRRLVHKCKHVRMLASTTNVPVLTRENRVKSCSVYGQRRWRRGENPHKRLISVFSVVASRLCVCVCVVWSTKLRTCCLAYVCY